MILITPTVALILVLQADLLARPRIALGLELSRPSKLSTDTTVPCTSATVWIVQLKGVFVSELMELRGQTILLLTY